MGSSKARERRQAKKDRNRSKSHTKYRNVQHDVLDTDDLAWGHKQAIKDWRADIIAQTLGKSWEDITYSEGKQVFGEDWESDTSLSQSDEFKKLIGWRTGVIELLSKVSSVISEQSVKFQFGNVPIGATDGKDVFIGAEWFNKEIAPAILKRDLGSVTGPFAVMKAVAYHELSHILWTPRFNQKPTVDIRKEGGDLFKAYNILEDQRIERMFTALYSPAIPLFSNLVLRFIVDNADEDVKRGAFKTKREAMANAYILVGGRKYLSKEVRNICRDAFVEKHGKTKTNKLDKIVDRYVKLVFPTNASEGYQLCAELRDLLENLQDSHATAPHTADTGSLMREGKPEIASDQSVIQDWADDQEQESEEDDSSEDTSPRGASEDSSDSDSDSEESGLGDADVSDNSDNMDSGSPEDLDADAPVGDESSGGLNTYSEQRSDENFDDVLKRMQESISQEISSTQMDADADALSSMKNIAKKISGEFDADKMTDTMSQGDFYYYSIEPKMRSQVNKLSGAIRTVFSDIEPEWVGGNSHGRLNPITAMESRSAHTDVFDVWETTGLGSDFEVVVLIDTSGSMHSNAIGPYLDPSHKSPLQDRKSLMDHACQSAWVVRQAFAKYEIPVTVVAYDNEAQVFSKAGSKVSNTQFEYPKSMGGSTNPRYGMRIANNIFKASSASNKLLVTLTDGEWFWSTGAWERSDECALMSEMDRNGVQSCLVVYEDSWEQEDWTDVCHINNRHNGHREMVRLRYGQHDRFAEEIGKRVIKLAGQMGSR